MVSSADRPPAPRTQQDWYSSVAIGQQAVQQVIDFLHTDLVTQGWLPTQLVHSVEDDPCYQPLGIDLLWVVWERSFLRCMTIEVKGDRNDRTGNFFFETVSNVDRTTSGGFVISKAEWLFYYFVQADKLYCLPMEQVKPWFLQNLARFPERLAASKRDASHWRTAGRLVPIRTVLHEAPAVRVFQQAQGAWQAA